MINDDMKLVSSGESVEHLIRYLMGFVKSDKVRGSSSMTVFHPCTYNYECNKIG